jgi:hypothetical protein
LARAERVNAKLTGMPVVALGASALGGVPGLIAKVCRAPAPDQARAHVQRVAVAVTSDGAALVRLDVPAQRSQLPPLDGQFLPLVAAALAVDCLTACKVPGDLICPL